MFYSNAPVPYITKSILAGEQYVIESDGLLIKGVTKKNAGTYTCRARVPQTGELEERDVRLDVSRQFYRSLLSCQFIRYKNHQTGF